MSEGKEILHDLFSSVNQSKDLNTPSVVGVHTNNLSCERNSVILNLFEHLYSTLKGQMLKQVQYDYFS